MDRQTLIGIFSSLPEDRMLDMFRNGGISFDGRFLDEEPQNPSVLENWNSQVAVLKNPPLPKGPLLDPIKPVLVVEKPQPLPQMQGDVPGEGYEPMLDAFQHSQGMGG